MDSDRKGTEEEAGKRAGGDDMRKRNRTNRRFLAVLLAVLTVVTVCNPTYAATARATTMRLEKTEGTVKLKTANGTARKISQGMRLFNGYTIETAKESYAYISLDDSKAVKLDVSSKVALRQKNKQLELLVKSGQLFFNVSTPLTDEETMNVRTGTMVTGIRGTCGVVKVVSKDVSKLYLLEGKVSFGGENPVTVYGGQIATVQKDVVVEAPTVKVTDMTETDIPIFAIQEVLEDPVLQEKIEKTTDLSVEKMEEHLEEILGDETEEENPEEGNKEEEKPTEENPVVPSNPSGPTPTPDLTGQVTVDQLVEKWKTFDAVTIAQGGSLNVTGTETVTVEEGKTLTVEEGATLNLTQGATLSVQSATGMVIHGEVTGDGTINVKAGSSLTNNGTIAGADLTVASDATVTNNGLITLTGTYGGEGAYSAGDNGLLICNTKSDSAALESKYLAVAEQNDTVLHCFYADYLNAQMAEQVNSIAKDKTIGVAFQKNAEVKSSVSLQGSGSPLQLKMGTNTLQVSSGTLTLASNVSVTGSGAQVISLTGGKLVLGANGKVSASKPSLENTTGMVVNIDASKYSSGVAVEWYDSALTIIAADVSGAITGLTTDASDTAVVKVLDYVKVQGALEWNGSTLSMMSPELTGTVSVTRLQAALNGYDTVTVTDSAKVSLSASDAISVPAGTTLNIKSVVTDSGQGGYSYGFYMSQNSVMNLKHGATLHVSGKIWNDGIINVGDASGTARVELMDTGTIEAGTIHLTNGTIENNGTFDIQNIISSGGSTINNNALIKLKGAYTYAGEVTGKDTYTGSPDSVLISNEESIAMPLESKLVVASLNGSISGDGTENAVQYMYADNLNATVANYMNNIKTLGGVDDLNQDPSQSVWWNFAKDAVVLAGTTIELKNINAELGTHKIQVEGKLTFTNTGTIQGTGDAVISLKSTGSLKLYRDAGNNETGIIQNTNSATNGFVIAVDGGILNSSTTHVTWNDTALTMQVANNIIGNTVQGMSYESDNDIVKKPGYLSYNGEFSWSSEFGTLSLKQD